MIIIFAQKVVLYSFPLGKDVGEGYKELVPRVCNIASTGGTWTGFLTTDKVLTSAFPEHENEFEVGFYHRPNTSGFLVRDFGDLMELGVGQAPALGKLMGSMKHPVPNQTLYVIGNFFGIPFELVTCVVERVGEVSSLAVRKAEMMDLHACGSPVFNKDGVLVGIVEAFVPENDKLIIRALIANSQGVIT